MKLILILWGSLTAGKLVANYAAKLEQLICLNVCEGPEIRLDGVKKSRCMEACNNERLRVDSECQAGRPQFATNGAAMCSNEGDLGPSGISGLNLNMWHKGCISTCVAAIRSAAGREETICQLKCNLDCERITQSCLSDRPAENEADLCQGIVPTTLPLTSPINPNNGSNQNQTPLNTNSTGTSGKDSKNPEIPPTATTTSTSNSASYAHTSTLLTVTILLLAWKN